MSGRLRLLLPLLLGVTLLFGATDWNRKLQREKKAAAQNRLAQQQTQKNKANNLLQQRQASDQLAGQEARVSLLADSLNLVLVRLSANQDDSSRQKIADLYLLNLKLQMRQSHGLNAAGAKLAGHLLQNAVQTTKQVADNGEADRREFNRLLTELTGLTAARTQTRAALNDYTQALNKLDTKLSKLMADQQNRQQRMAEYQKQANRLSVTLTSRQNQAALNAPVRFYLPVTAPVKRYYGSINAPGGRTMNNGLDFSLPSGSPVRAAAGGTVVYSRWFEGYGQTVILSHPDGWYSLYANNEDTSVSEGGLVIAGECLAHSGRSPLYGDESLHFEIRRGGEPLDPLPFLGLK